MPHPLKRNAVSTLLVLLALTVVGLELYRTTADHPSETLDVGAKKCEPDAVQYRPAARLVRLEDGLVAQEFDIFVTKSAKKKNGNASANSEFISHTAL